MIQFQSTLSLRRATIVVSDRIVRRDDFNPRSPCGERRKFGGWLKIALPISIHALLAESDRHSLSRRCRTIPISIHALLAESDCWVRRHHQGQAISIHALLAESDVPRWDTRHRPGHFNPRSPCGERLRSKPFIRSRSSFQSTLSLRRATTITRSEAELRREISIHALLAESDEGADPNGGNHIPISIHALLAESDDLLAQYIAKAAEFQSTLSLRRATLPGV